MSAGERSKVAGGYCGARVAFSALLLAALASCKASPPGKFETYVATQVKQRITVGGTKDRNPFSPSAPNIIEGRQQFQNYCSSCHGPDGLNSGVIFADKMSPPVPPLNSPEVQEFKDGQLKRIIQYGVSPSGMPGWRETLGDDDIWKIVLFIRHLPGPAQPTQAGR